VVQSTSKHRERHPARHHGDRTDGFPVRLLRLDRGAVVDRQVRVASVRETPHAHTDWQELLACFAQAEVVVSNTADTGFHLDPSDDAGLLVDPAATRGALPGSWCCCITGNSAIPVVA
jgi:tagaturonate reductase